MFESFFRRESVISRLRKGPFGGHLEDLTSSMRERGYAFDTIRLALKTGDQFARWLCRRGGLPDANETTGAVFIKTLGQPSNAHPSKCASVLHHVIRVLREKGIVEQPPDPQSDAPAQQWLLRFEAYRERVLGSVPSTQQRYRSILREFLSNRFGVTEPDWSALPADDMTQFLQRQASGLRGYGRNVPAVALRAFLRFLTSEGRVRDGLQRAIPTMRKWRHAPLPPTLTENQIEALLANEQHPWPVFEETQRAARVCESHAAAQCRADYRVVPFVTKAGAPVHTSSRPRISDGLCEKRRRITRGLAHHYLV